MTEEQGRQLAEELGIKFMETSAKVNDGVEEAFFTLARSVFLSEHVHRRLVDVHRPQRYQDKTDRFTSGRSRKRCRRQFCGNGLR